MLSRVIAWFTRPAPTPVVIAGREDAAPGVPWAVLVDRLQRDATAYGVAYAWRCGEPEQPPEVLPLDVASVFPAAGASGAAEFYEVLRPQHIERCTERRSVRLESSEVLRIRFGEDALGKLREWLEGDK